MCTNFLVEPRVAIGNEAISRYEARSDHIRLKCKENEQNLAKSITFAKNFRFEAREFPRQSSRGVGLFLPSFLFRYFESLVFFSSIFTNLQKK